MGEGRRGSPTYFRPFFAAFGETLKGTEELAGRGGQGSDDSHWRSFSLDTVYMVKVNIVLCFA